MDLCINCDINCAKSLHFLLHYFEKLSIYYSVKCMYKHTIFENDYK